MSVRILRAERMIPRPRAEVFAYLLERPAGVPHFFRGWGPLVPGIASVEVLGDGVVRAGALRRVRMEDGSSFVEKVAALEPPSLHAYEIAEPSAMQAAFTVSLRARFELEDTPGGGTSLRWTYTIEPRGGLRGLGARVMGGLLGRAMQAALDELGRRLG